MKLTLTKGLSYTLVVTKDNPTIEVDDEVAEMLLETGYFTKAEPAEDDTFDTDVLKIPTPEETILNKSVSNMVDNIVVHKDGSVSGTFKHVKDFEDFSSVTEEKEGYYFPFNLPKGGNKVTIKKNGAETKKDIDFPDDNNFVFRVSKNDTFEVIVDGDSIVKFSFSGAEFQPDPIAMPRLDSMTISQLETYAAYKDISIKGLSRKADIIAKISAETGIGAEEALTDVGSPTMQELQE